MHKKVNPMILVVAGIFLVAVLGLLFMRTFTSHEPAYTVSPPSQDADGAAAKRANMIKRGIVPPDNPAAGKPADRQ